MEQAKHLGLDLFLIPLPKQTSNEEYCAVLHAAIEELREQLGLVAQEAEEDGKGGTFGSREKELRAFRLVFGDVHLQDVKEFREKSFPFPSFVCHFPLFGLPTCEILRRLDEAKAQQIFRDIVICKWNGTVSSKVEDEGSLLGYTSDASKASELEGKSYDPSSLPEGCDQLGEKGEFHTFVQFS